MFHISTHSSQVILRPEILDFRIFLKYIYIHTYQEGVQHACLADPMSVHGRRGLVRAYKPPYTIHHKHTHSQFHTEKSVKVNTFGGLLKDDQHMCVYGHVYVYVYMYVCYLPIADSITLVQSNSGQYTYSRVVRVITDT